MDFESFNLTKLQSLFKMMEDNGCTEISIGDVVIKKNLLGEQTAPKKDNEQKSLQDDLFAHLPAYTRFIERE